jgi:peptidoglycan/xylan/chitin deacetylase (PgdA/CDA1 family)
MIFLENSFRMYNYCIQDFVLFELSYKKSNYRTIVAYRPESFFYICLKFIRLIALEAQLSMRLSILLILLFVCIVRSPSQPKVTVANYFGDRRAAVSYTFDDGLLCQYTELFPMLQKFGIKATFAICGRPINQFEEHLRRTGNDTTSFSKPRMTWDMVREISRAGHEISSHGWAHKNITTLEGEALRYEVQHNDSAIWQHTGHFPFTYCFPGNRKSPDKVAYVEKGRVAARIKQISIGSKRNDKWLHDWVRDLIDEGDWGVGMTHGISSGYDHFKNPEVLWRHFADLQTLRDKLWVAPLCEVAAYIKERNNIRIKVKRHGHGYIIVPKMTLDKHVFREPLTLIVRGTVARAKQDGHSLKVSRNGHTSLLDIQPCGGKIYLELSEE